jgi:2-polyprenyl-6-methoxyphenol hydroxylase-like FAD-dependent oxidoreductase
MMMPQWDFLDFLAEHARKLPGFHLVMKAEASRLISEDDRVVGLVAQTPEGELEVRAALVVGADGRHSTIRRLAGLQPQDFGAPMDVLWLRVSRKPDDPPDLFGQIDAGRMLVMIARGDYWQCALLIPKGSAEAWRARGLGALHETLLALSPWLGERVEELVDWDAQVKPLSVTVDRLREWAKPGLLCIGDAAHAMSPIGGVGINLAVQDGVAAARLLAGPLREHALDLAALQRVQRRREWPVRVVQRMQLTMQDRLIAPILARQQPVRMPWLLRLVDRFALLRRIPAWFIGVGVRPEHVS